jgi:DnaJ family protein C protein 19
MKLLWVVALAIVAWRVVAGRWPWQSRVDMRKRDEIARACDLLEVSPLASRQEIIDAHRRALSVVHPDRGGSNEAVHLVNAARDTLLAEVER